MATYVNDLRLKEIATGDESGTWGTSTNTNLELIAEAFSFGTEAITTNADTHATTIADGSTDPGRSIYLKYTGTLDSACTITIGPNTVSKLWFIENGTSGSQNIIISQGSGANVTIPAGHVKAVYSDGAGSGAAIVDAFTDLNLAGTTTVDVLSGSGNATIGGTLGVTGIVTLTDDLIIGDGKTIGSASDVDAMTIASNGQVTFSQTLIGTALDISGDIDVDGTTNLDVVDIDGAVDMASTLAVGGVVTANAGVVVDNITIDGTEIDLSSGDLTLDAAGDIILDADGGNVTFKDGGTAIGDLVNSSSDFVIESKVQDKDIIFKGDDGGSGITALTLDMSAAGAATFNNNVTCNRVNTTDGINDTGQGGSETVFNESGSTADFRVESDSNTHMLFVDGGSNSVGIGTSSPSEPLHVNEGTGGVSTTLLLQNSSASVDGRGTNLTFKSSSTEIGQIQSKTTSDATSGILAFKTASSGTLSEQMRIDKDGNVGIGTTSPSHKLHVVSSGNGEIKAERTSGAAILTQAQSALGKFGTTSNHNLQLMANNTGHLTITTAGNLGLGTTSPSKLLHIKSADPVIRLEDSSPSAYAEIDGAGGDLIISCDAGDDDANSVIKFKVDNSEKAVIDSSGNLGLGDTSPDNKLHVNSGTSNVVAKFESTDSIAAIQLKDNNGEAEIGNVGDDIAFFPAGSEKVRITSSGNLGIGTSSPGKLLHLTGSAAQIRIEDSDGTNQIADITSDSGDMFLTSRNNTSHGEIVFRRFNGTSVLETARIDASGNLGIGTSSPAQALDVVGAIKVSDGILNSGAAGSASVFNEDGTTADFRVESTSNTHMLFVDGGLNRVGIGTSSPSGTLHIKDSAGADLYLEAGTTSENSVISFGDPDDNNIGIIGYAHSDNSMRFTTNASERMRLNTDGDILFGVTSLSTTGAYFESSSNSRMVLSLGSSTTSNSVIAAYKNPNGTVGTVSTNGSATAYNTSSDARLKDVTGFARGLEVINELNPVAYNWKADGKADEGLIAQEVEELVPNAISQTEDGYYQMDYSKLVTHLVKGMQEQQKQIESLKSEIADLKGE